MNEISATVTIARYTSKDVPEIINLVRNFLNEERVFGYQNHFFGIDFNAHKLYTLLNNRERDGKFFTNIVKDASGKIIGGLGGSIHSYIFSDELVAKDYLLYFDPSFRNVTVLYALINSYVEWAQTHNVREVQLCSSTGFKQDKFEKLLQRCGFSPFEVGYSRRF